MPDSMNRFDEVLSRGFVRVGISGNAPGFSVQDNGSYTGFDVDFGRALAAALFGDPNAVEFVLQDETTKYSDVAQGIVDVTSNRATFSLMNDAAKSVDFAPINFYDFQGILVKSDSQINTLADINDQPIGVLNGTNSGQNIRNAFAEFNQSPNLVRFDTADALYAAYENGEIVAISTNASSLVARIPTLSNPSNHQVLDQIVAKEPFAMVIPENESEFADVVEWVNYATFQADEFGITSANLNDILATNSNPIIARFLGQAGDLGAALGLANDFVVNIIASVGNYEEIYQRHFGSFNLPTFNLGRNLNQDANEFGLLLSPPFAGSTGGVEDELIDNDNRNVLQEVLDRGYVIIGVEGNLPGLSQEVEGEFSGFNVELGRAIAAALFGDPNAVEFVVQPSFLDNFTATANGEVDITIAPITQNLVRDASLGVEFPLLFGYDGQAIIAAPGITELSDLANRRISLVEGSTSVQNIEDAFASIGETFEPVFVDSFDTILTPFLNGEADAASIDFAIILSQLIELNARKDELSPEAVERLENYVFLDDVLSKETLAFVTDENQSEWGDVVRWIGYSLMQAEEFGITGENVADLAATSTDPDIRQFLGVEGNLGESLGIPNDFALNAIAAVGNYGQILEREFGVLGIDLEQLGGAQLYSEGGLLYPPPFTGEVSAMLDINANNIVSFQGTDTTNLLFTLMNSQAAFPYEVGVYQVDDAQGTINGIAPGESGYLEAALRSQAQVIFSPIANQPQGFNPTLNRILEEFSSRDRLGFYLIQNSTTEIVQGNIAAGVAPPQVFFGTPDSLEVSELTGDGFQLVWDEIPTDELDELIFTVEMTNQLRPKGAESQGFGEQEILDLQSLTGKQSATFTLHREAAYNNMVSFYEIDSLTGDVNGVKPGESGYLDAVLDNRVLALDGQLAVENQGEKQVTVELDGGTLLAPFIIIDGTLEELLDSDSGNDPSVYFPYLGANGDGFDHIRSLGDNVFGFEDLPNGGDSDYNDMLIQVDIA
ncbi:transporter substrate-binding domain-containing protein [Coleofasciculus sp.]|uniref:transporter substrate-binding domain-containing protein n=1 Tax=Coleofasciculus sp. TaxID=3100458 RepID=UPI003B4C964C